MPTGSWWKRTLGWVKKHYEIPVHAAESNPPSAVRRVDLIPGQLSADVWRHELQTHTGTVACWTYVTKGLQRHRQPEIVFTLVRQSHDRAAPEEPLGLFLEIDALAKAGHLVHAGGFTQFGVRKFLGRHLAYIPAPELSDVVLPPSAICAILVTEDEVEAVQEFGITRLMARLGQAARYYPCPPWSDPARQGISFAQVRNQTLLGRVVRLRPLGCRAYQADGEVVLLLAKGSGELLARQLADMPRDTAFALLTEFDPSADGCFVWESGQSGPVAITPDGSTGKRICGCFLTFAVGQAEDGALGLEDGFAAILTPQSWQAIRDAVSREERKRIPPTGGRMAFRVDWDSENFQNPVDGKSYLAQGGWRDYHPQADAERSTPEEKVSVDHCRLLTAQNDFAARVTVEDFGEFSKRVTRQVEIFLGQSDKTFELLVQFKCKRSGHEVQMAHRGEADQGLLQRLYDSLITIETLRVKEDDVSFQIHFKISP